MKHFVQDPDIAESRPRAAAVSKIFNRRQDIQNITLRMGSSVLFALGLFFSLVSLQNSGCLTGTVVRIPSQPPVQGHQCKPQEHNLPAMRCATPSWFPVPQAASTEQDFLRLSIRAECVLVQCCGNRPSHWFS